MGCVLPTSSQEPKESTEKEISVPYRFVYIYIYIYTVALYDL